MIFRFEYLIYLILIIIGIGAPWSFLHSLDHVNPIEFKSLLVSIPFIMYIPFLVVYLKNTPRISINRSKALLFIIFIFASISIFWSNNLELFFRKWILLFWFITTVLFVEEGFRKSSFDRLAYFLISTVLIVAIVGLGQFYFNFPDNNLLPSHQTPASTFGNKNPANHLIPIVFPLFFYLFYKTREIKRLLYILIAFILVILYVFVAETKAVWIAMLIQLSIITLFFFFHYLFSNKKFDYKYLVFSLVVIVSISFISIKFSPLNDKLSNIYSTIIERIDNPNAHRKLIYKSSVNLIIEKPIFGYGLGNFNDAIQKEGYHKMLLRGHSDTLELIIELGFIGFFLFTMLIISLTYDLRSLKKEGKSNIPLFFISIGILGSFIGAQVSFPYQHLPVLFILAIYTGLIFKEIKSNNTKSFLTISLDSNLTKNTLVVFFALPMFFAVYKSFAWTINMSELYKNSGTEGRKYNFNEMKKSIAFPERNIHVYAIGKKFWDAGYMNRASEIFLLATEVDKNANFMRFQQFTYFIKIKDFESARKIYSFMKENHPNHYFTFEMGMSLSLSDKDLITAKNIYTYYKDVEANSKKPFPETNLIKLLHRWSISTQNYQDTEYFYKKLVSLTKFDPTVENWMAKYYAYNSMLEDSLRHMILVLNNQAYTADSRVLNALIAKKLISKEEVHNLKLSYYLIDGNLLIHQGKKFGEALLKELEIIYDQDLEVSQKNIELLKQEKFLSGDEDRYKFSSDLTEKIRKVSSKILQKHDH